jgi:phage-related minor tail protein
MVKQKTINDKMKTMIKKIKVVWNLIKFTVASGVKILTDSMKKEAQTYKEEKEQQKKNKRMMNEKEKK